MSVEYYLISKEKKIEMTLFSMNFGSIWQADKRYLFDFVLACGGGEMKLVHEESPERPEFEDEAEYTSWTHINTFEPYKEKAGCATDDGRHSVIS